MQDVKVAISEIKDMDDEHGAFWVGHTTYEDVLEAHKDLKVIYAVNDNPENELIARFKSWEEIDNLYQLFLNSEFEMVKEVVKNTGQ